MRSYETARSLFSFLAFMAWSVVVIGVLVALIGAAGASQYGGSGAGLLAMVPGIGIGITGLILVAFVQMGRATVDTAEYSQQILKVARDQLEVSRQGLKQGSGIASGFTSADALPTQKNRFERADVSGATRNGVVSDRPASIPAPPPPILEGENINYMGKTITRERGVFLVGARSFKTLGLAKNFAELADEVHDSRTR
jgi:hypothetical protein